MRQNEADPISTFHSTSVANPDSGSGAFLTQGSWIEKSRIRDEHPGSDFRELRNTFRVKNTKML
jgi:hypothetical protein